MLSSIFAISPLIQFEKCSEILFCIGADIKTAKQNATAVQFVRLQTMRAVTILFSVTIAFQGEITHPGCTLKQSTDDTIHLSEQSLSVVYDPPHLMKGVRNNFPTKNIVIEGKTSKWQDLLVEKIKVKVKDSVRTGAGADEVYVPTLWYFDALSFLGSVSEPCRTGRDTIKTDEITTSSSETESVQKSESASPQKKKRVTKASLLQKHESLINTAGKLLQMKEEEWEIIGKGIGLQLKDLKKRQFYIAQKIIHDTLYYAQMELLTEHSSVSGLAHNQSQHTYETTVANRSTPQRYQAPFRNPGRRPDTQSLLSGASSSPKYYINSDSHSSWAIPSSPSPSPKGVLIESPQPSPSHYTQPQYSSPTSLPQQPSPQQVVYQSSSQTSASNHTQHLLSSPPSMPQGIIIEPLQPPMGNEPTETFPQLQLTQRAPTTSMLSLETTPTTCYELFDLDSINFPNTTVSKGDGKSMKEFLIFKQKK